MACGARRATRRVRVRTVAPTCGRVVIMVTLSRLLDMLLLQTHVQWPSEWTASPPSHCATSAVSHRVISTAPGSIRNRRGWCYGFAHTCVPAFSGQSPSLIATNQDVYPNGTIVHYKCTAAPTAATSVDDDANKRNEAHAVNCVHGEWVTMLIGCGAPGFCTHILIFTQHHLIAHSEHVRGYVTTMPTLTPVPPVVQSPSPVPTPAEPVSSAPTTSTAVIPTTASRVMCTHPTFVGQNGAYFIDAHFVHKYQSSAPVAAGVRLMVGEEENVNVLKIVTGCVPHGRATHVHDRMPRWYVAGTEHDRLRSEYS
ncbi:unnamed protein product [Sphagnum balticum]